MILLDSPTKAGARLAIPSLLTPLGGLIAGVVMSRWGKLAFLVRLGSGLMFIGNLLVTLLRFDDSNWKYFAYIIPANLGQGIVYPGILFTFLAAFDHSGMYLIHKPNVTITNLLQTMLSPHQPYTSSAHSATSGAWRSHLQLFRTF